MNTYIDSVRAQCEANIANKLANREASKKQAEAGWQERLTPLEDRLSKLLATMPNEIKQKGLALTVLRGMLSGKWRGNCHPGELGDALRKLGYLRKRKWSTENHSFSALWFPKDT